MCYITADMKNNIKNLDEKTGLSLSQAETISSSCNQRCMDIDSMLSNLNNCTKTIKVDGEVLTQQRGKKIPDNIEEIILEKGKLRAVQAYLREHINLKDSLIKEEKNKLFVFSGEMPKYPEFVNPTLEQPVDETWAASKMTIEEWTNFIEAEAYSAHIGQFIHKNSPLDKLRKELPNIPDMEWMKPDDKAASIPVKIEVHNTQENLLALHDKFSLLHRKYEQIVNSYKAKIKNLVTDENARIAKNNADKLSEFNKEKSTKLAEYEKFYKEYLDKYNVEEQLFEETKMKNIKKIAAYKITVDKRFKDLIDKYSIKA